MDENQGSHSNRRSRRRDSLTQDGDENDEGPYTRMPSPIPGPSRNGRLPQSFTAEIPLSTAFGHGNAQVSRVQAVRHVVTQEQRERLVMMHRDFPPNMNQEFRPNLTAPRATNVPPWARDGYLVQSSTPEQRLNAAGMPTPSRNSRATRPAPEGLDEYNEVMWAPPRNSRAMRPASAGLDEYNEVMWARFRYEYLRLELGVVQRFSDGVCEWLDSVVLAYFIRRRRSTRIRRRFT